MRTINLDQASTSFPKAPSVAKAMYDFIKNDATNVSRGAYSGSYALAIVPARRALIGALPRQIGMAVWILTR